jgi:hypothetical protein
MKGGNLKKNEGNVYKVLRNNEITQNIKNLATNLNSPQTNEENKQDNSIVSYDSILLSQ